MQRLMDLADDIGPRLKSRGETIAIAESSTGGLISAALLAVPGASQYFLGGAVVYTRAARKVLLNFSDDDARMRAATEDYAALLAATVRSRFGATWGLGESGATGPAGNRYGDPPGHVCIAVAGPVSRAVTLATGRADREANMRQFAEAALDFFKAAVAAQAH